MYANIIGISPTRTKERDSVSCGSYFTSSKSCVVRVSAFTTLLKKKKSGTVMDERITLSTEHVGFDKALNRNKLVRIFQTYILN